MKTTPVFVNMQGLATKPRSSAGYARASSGGRNRKGGGAPLRV